ncbi:BRO-N domain-containing protein [Sphingobium abikonense]|uniref:BRO-N domain-containing protein n=1 Tax=Sphingobium abikonense TaxID=86193 RepID=UPI00078951EA|nr:BRO family protein [Sphingobium abikonense]
MSALSIFLFHADQVRTVIIDGEIWFVAGDVSKILGYRDAANMLRNLDKEEQRTHSVSRLEGGRLVERPLTIISESGVYHAILKSRRPEAVAFRKWVTGTLLPKLAREGSFNLAAANAPNRFILLDRREKAVRAIAAAQSEGAKEIHWRTIAAYCEALGDPCPPIEAFGRASSADMADMRRLWAIIRPALDTETLANHSRNADAGEIALHPTELLPFLADRGMPLQRTRLLDLLRLSDNPRFMAAKNVNSRDGAIRRCIVFRHLSAGVNSFDSDQPLLPFDGGASE